MQTEIVNLDSLVVQSHPYRPNVCPKKGAVYGDKGYCVKPARLTLESRGCHDGTAKKNNMKCKNRDLDRWHTKIRAPYERVFSKQRKRVRYRGIAKNQFTAFFQAICFNLKRLAVLQELPSAAT